jgi:hypothetical protein
MIVSKITHYINVVSTIFCVGLIIEGRFVYIGIVFLGVLQLIIASNISIKLNTIKAKFCPIYIYWSLMILFIINCFIIEYETRIFISNLCLTGVLHCYITYKLSSKIALNKI